MISVIIQRKKRNCLDYALLFTGDEESKDSESNPWKKGSMCLSNLKYCI